MVLAATGLMVLASVMAWANENSTVTARNSEYFTTTYAAEAATEKALGAIVQDDENYGEGLVFIRNAAGYYNTLIPTVSDSPYWGNYQFSGGTTDDTIIVACINTCATNVLGPPYSGLQSVGATYQIIANAKNTNTMYGVEATVGQQVVLGQIPIFQFAIFYNDTLEIDPGANMAVTGMVHGNTNLYIVPNSRVTLTFSNDVSATGSLNLSKNPLDPSGRTSSGTTTFLGAELASVNPLNLPVGTNTSGSATNGGESVSAILQVPPPDESPTVGVGTNRLYNQVDMIISISDGNVISVTSGMAVNNAATIISNAPFVSTNGAFYNMRDGSEVAPIDIDVGQLRQWSATNTVLTPLLTTIRGASQANVQSIFVVDQRFLSNYVITTNSTCTTNTVTFTSSSYPTAGTYIPPITTNTTGYTYASIIGTETTLSYTTNLIEYAEPGVVLTNGATLPANGLSVVTPDPLYIVGNWNVTNDSGQGQLQTHDVSDTLPSAVFADAVTILSPAWNPNNSSNSISSRTAAPDTVNAAILTGIVPSNGTYYSGGVENFVRLQEDWTGVSFCYNGSMVEMFQSQVANYPWPGTGIVYNPPNRNWAYDTNFSNPSQLPPLTPKIIYINRARWSSLAPGATAF
jgi:hypothetical protein